MSRDELSEMEQMGNLSRELETAGRVAGDALQIDEERESAFVSSLRVRLLSQWPGAAASTAAVCVPAPERFLGPKAVREPISGGEPSRSGYVALGSRWRWQAPTRLRLPGGFATGLAACLAIVSLVAVSGYLWMLGPTGDAGSSGGSVVVESSSATIVRNGAATPLVAGMALHPNDEIEVAAGGSASLKLLASYARLDGGTDLILTQLSASRTVLGQIAGRVYHRVTVPAGGSYVVNTATVTWEAHGTAFDLDRHATASGGEEVRALALQHDLGVAGPQLSETLLEGDSATVELSAGGNLGGAPVIEPISALVLTDPWLETNARKDALLGLPLGRLGAASPSPAPTGAPADLPSPIATAEPIESPTATPTSTASLATTPRPTAAPTPRPTYAAGLGNISATRNGDGSYTFGWSAYHGSIAISQYEICFTTTGSGAFGYVEGIGTCAPTTGISWTGSPAPANYRIKVEAVYFSNSAAATAAETIEITFTVAGASPSPSPIPVNLGTPSFHDNGDGTYTFGWTAYTGTTAIGAYVVCWSSTTSGAFGYVEGSGNVHSADKAGSTWTGTLAPGTWRVKVEALYWPPVGRAVAVGVSEIITITIPAATPSPTPTPPPVVNLGAPSFQDNGDGTFTFNWNAYTGPLTVAYLISGTDTTGTFGYIETGVTWPDAIVTDTTWTGAIGTGTWRIKVEAVSTSTGSVIKAGETSVYYLTVP